jgi:hypothetical protein
MTQRWESEEIEGVADVLRSIRLLNFD